MTDYNELIGELRDQADVIGPGTESHLLRTAADTIEALDERAAIAAVESAPAWIPITDGLPEPGRMVLVTVCGHDVIVARDGESLAEAVRRIRKQVRYVTIGSLDDDGYWTLYDGFPMVVQPSYWMPFPEMPEVDDG